MLRVLEAVRLCGLKDTCRIYQASTSELYGKVEEVPQNENTPFHPYSPYAVAKQYGFWITKEYREAYDMFAVNGILFNHESERRGENFVTRKITLAAGRIAEGLQDHLELGNLDSKRDWGYAKDYVECMWMILQHDTPEDFVIATGEQHTVQARRRQSQRDFVKMIHASASFLLRHRALKGRCKPWSTWFHAPLGPPAGSTITAHTPLRLAPKTSVRSLSPSMAVSPGVAPAFSMACR